MLTETRTIIQSALRLDPTLDEPSRSRIMRSMSSDKEPRVRINGPKARKILGLTTTIWCKRLNTSDQYRALTVIGEKQFNKTIRYFYLDEIENIRDGKMPDGSMVKS